MKKTSLFISGLVVTLSIGLNSFAGSQNQYLNRGDTGGAPARPDYASIGDGGGAPARPDYVNIGDTGGAPANFNKGDGGVSQL